MSPPAKRTRCDVDNFELVLVPVGSKTAPVLQRMSNFIFVLKIVWREFYVIIRELTDLYRRFLPH